jgi:hypothetical protein
MSACFSWTILLPDDAVSSVEEQGMAGLGFYFLGFLGFFKKT